MTRQQHTLLNFIREQIAATGLAPSFDEMKTRMGLKSKSEIHRIVKALDGFGFIRRWPNRARAIEIVRMPGEVSPDAAIGKERKRCVDLVLAYARDGGLNLDDLATSILQGFPAAGVSDTP